MIKCGIASLKIEGRMKSEYYIGQVVKTYRKMIDEIYFRGHLTEERLAYYDEELSKAENRPSDDGFLSGDGGNLPAFTDGTTRGGQPLEGFDAMAAPYFFVEGRTECQRIKRSFHHT